MKYSTGFRSPTIAQRFSKTTPFQAWSKLRAARRRSKTTYSLRTAQPYGLKKEAVRRCAAISSLARESLKTSEEALLSHRKGAVPSSKTTCSLIAEASLLSPRKEDTPVCEETVSRATPERSGF